MTYDLENNLQLYTLLFDNWYEVGSFRRALAQIRCLDLSVQENRNRALSTLNGAVLAAPFAADRRFVQTGFYFTDSQEPFRTALSRLRQLITSRARQTEMGRSEVHAFAATSDVIKAGEEALKVLWDATANIEHLWNRAKFERELPWVVPQSSTPANTRK